MLALFDSGTGPLYVALAVPELVPASLVLGGRACVLITPASGSRVSLLIRLSFSPLSCHVGCTPLFQSQRVWPGSSALTLCGVCDGELRS